MLINFHIVKHFNHIQKNKKILLIIAIFSDLGMLAYFKYSNFFIDNFNVFLNALNIDTISWVKVALPVGISFFSFQSLTYTIDVYRKTHAPLQKLTDYMLYILMFSQLIAGPIVRFSMVANEIVDRKKNETIENKLTGFYRFSIGLAKKVLIANVLGEQVDKIYALPLSEIDSTLAWIAIIAYSFQIYFDFSGYSDMAIGLGKMIGFNFPENFNNPYISKNITEFWRRWHMTLGAWMKDYLYIPLGGNHVKTKNRLFFNLIVVFLLSGLWHGAAWNFVLWGAWHGLFLILDRIIPIQKMKWVGNIAKIMLTYLIVIIGWVFFRIEHIADSIFYLKQMFSFNYFTPLSFFNVEFYTILFIAVLFSFITFNKYGRKIETLTFYSSYNTFGHLFMFALSLILFLISAAYITSFGFNPFIYYRF